MNSPILQLLVLAGIAIFLILRLRNVLGTRDGFEPPREMSAPVARRTPDFEVIDEVKVGLGCCVTHAPSYWGAGIGGGACRSQGGKELIIADGDEAEFTSLVSESGTALSTLGRSAFDSTAGEKRLIAFYGVSSLDAFGNFDRAQISALSAVAEYLDITQKGNLPLLRPPVVEGRKAA